MSLQMQEEETRLLKEHEEQLLKDLKAAVQAEKEGKKMTRQTKPAIVLENREPPEIPEFKMEEATTSPYAGEDAILYMFRLSLFSRIRKVRQELKEERAKLERESQASESGDGVEGQAKGRQQQRESEASSDSDVVLSEDLSTSDSVTKGAGAKASGRTKKSKSKSKKQRKKKEAPPPPPPKPVDNQQSYERDPEVERILNEVVETLNRNMTPVQRRIPSRVLPRNREPVRPEDVRIKYDPPKRPWPSMEECDEMELPRYLVFTSTWLSVTAKGVE